MVRKQCPPKWAVRMVRLARIGEFRDEWENYLAEMYEAKLVESTERYGEERGKKHADYWAYLHASKTLFIAIWEWAKVALILYMQLTKT
jgi:hypothetical protein